MTLLNSIANLFEFIFDTLNRLMEKQKKVVVPRKDSLFAPEVA